MILHTETVLNEQKLVELVDEIVKQRLTEIEKNYSPYMNKFQCCEYIGVSNNTLDKLIKDKKMPVFKDGRSYIFNKQHIDKWFEETSLNKK